MIVAGNKTLFMDGEQGIKVMQALGNETRLLMLSLLSHRTLNLSALAEAINLPQSTTAFHLKQLEGAGLVNVQYLPGTRGQQKLISKRYDEVHFKLPGVAIESASNVVEVSMPVGNYKRITVKPTCGIATDTKYIGMIDDVRSFYEPEHVFAQILWFRQGFVEYDFPNNIPYGSQATELQFAMEICSEAPEYDLDWPSDITLSVNGVENRHLDEPGRLRRRSRPADAGMVADRANAVRCSETMADHHGWYLRRRRKDLGSESHQRQPGSQPAHLHAPRSQGGCTQCGRHQPVRQAFRQLQPGSRHAHALRVFATASGPTR